MEHLMVWGKRVLAVVGLVVLIFLVTDFNSRMAELTRLLEQKEIEQARLEGLQATQADLQAQIAYATSDAAVEAWAREEGRLVQPGDHPIIPIPQGEVQTAPQKAEASSPEALTKWDVWLEWLFPID